MLVVVPIGEVVVILDIVLDLVDMVKPWTASERKNNSRQTVHLD